MTNKDYNDFNLADFMADEEFRLWVLKEDARRDVFWKKWMLLHPEKKKTALKAREIILSMHFHKAGVEKNEKDQTLDMILKGERSKRFYLPANGDNRSGAWLKAAAAVGLVLAASIIFLILRQQGANEAPAVYQAENIVKENPGGKKLTFMLPDSSLVVLNSKSKLTFPERFADDRRVVHLTGEAYFQVATDERRPFTVKTEKISTNVLGTAFNVKAFPESGEVAVSLVEGAVKVISENREGFTETTVLKPGEKVRIDSKDFHHTKTHLDPLADIGWKDGILFFNGEDYLSVKEKIERWYGVKIITLNNPGSMEIKGRFDNISLEALLDNFHFMHNIEYAINGKTVTIKFKE